MKKHIYFFVVAMLFGVKASAQLAAGDIAFIGYNTDSGTGTNDNFTFITLTDIPGSEIIYFTEEGWNNLTDSWAGTTEGHITYTAPAGGLSCGTIVTINESTASSFTVTGGGTATLTSGTSWSLSGGDQVLAYQAATPEPATTPTFIAGVHGDDGNGAPITLDPVTFWNSALLTPLGTARSEQPAGLTNGTDCVALFHAVGTEDDNAKYTGSLTGDAATVRSNINNYLNWSTNNTTAYAITPSDYTASVTCSAPCTEPDVPTVTFTPATVCTGNTATLSISGSLNDATEWHIYTGSCGGTEIGTTAGSSFTVSPAAPSTTYFVRGEGGCTTPGSCGSVTVTVTADDDASFSYSASTFCPNGTDPSPTATTAGGTYSSAAGLSIVAGSGLVDLSASTPGAYTITYTTAGSCPSSSNVSFTIEDNTDPVPTLASLPDVTAQCSVTSLTPPTATDNCGGSVSVSHNATLPITTQGTTVVTWTYDDGNGNTTTQTQNVVIDDTTDPVPSAGSLADITDECQVTSLTSPTATDNCGGSVSVSHDATLPITTQGTTVVTWTYDDGNGNTTTQTQNVVIDDITDPVPSAGSLADITDECQVTSLSSPSATDNCGGTVTVTHDATLPITTQGTTVVTWTYDDGNGNTVTQTQNVIIDDVTDPVPGVATISDVTAQCQVTSLTNPTVTDNCGSVIITNDATLPITTQGTTVVTWTYDDGNGNTVTQTQNVVIDDTTNPTPDVATLSDVTAQCEVTSLTPPTATDNCGGSVSVSHDVTLPITMQGTTVVTWTYNDGNGNTTTQTQNIVIDDTTNPTPDVATLSDVTAQCEVTSLTPPTATDNCGGSVSVSHDAALPITTQGTTVVTWTYDDGNGNTATQTQNVIIDDVTNPVPDAASLSDITDECEVTSLPTPTGTDNCGGVVMVTNDATLPITAQGTTVVTWTYDDGNGNTVTQTQNVIIDDVTDPMPDMASLADVMGECEVISLTPPTGTDNCGSVIVTNDATLPITTQGATVVTWTYDDGNGNTVTQTQNVILNDVTAPNPDAASLEDVVAQCEVTSLTPPTATDNCGGLVTVTHDAVLPITIQGMTMVTWTYDDGNGNTTTQIQNVVIDDTTNPIPDEASLTDITAECEVMTLTDPTATDNCGGIVTVTHDAVLPITEQGTTIVTWTYDDGNGNTTTQTQNVIIDDVTNPVPDLVSLEDITDECEIVELDAPTGVDNCGSLSVTHDATLPITDQGTTVVTWTYDDGNGNTVTQTQNVIIDDITDPVPDVIGLSDVTAECEITSLVSPTGTDNCGAVLVTHDATLPITEQGMTVVTWTYDDGNGNTVTQTQNVIIDDITAPVPDVEVLEDVTAECLVTELEAPTATDNCAAIIVVSHDATLPITEQGTTVVTWTYDDGNGNTTTQSQNVIVDDITAPIPDTETLEDITAECEVTELTAPTASDNCVEELTISHDVTLPITEQGTTVVTWTYDDGNGNTTTQSQNVIIDDVTAPVPDAEALEDILAECEVTELASPTATDNCVEELTITHDATLPITESTTITWTYDDGNGNTVTQAQAVVIDDITAPVPDVESLEDITAGCEVTELTAPTATDNCVAEVIVTHDATLPITESTTITWTYDDGNGNTSTQTQEVVIEINVDVTVIDAITLMADLAEDATYQWINCDNNTIIEGEIDQTFTAEENGNYAVIVSVGTCSDTSECLTISEVGLAEVVAEQMIIYPNPTTGNQFNIQTDAKIEAILIYDLQGRTVDAFYNPVTGEVKLNGIDSGKYIVSIQTESGNFITKTLIVLR